ncbi:hypothetical protein EVAR_89522_1 [Eumeta japonica]|uniref:Secreted protein n=1 Tax=Eumeta variegata TaxID=151549 RepID=A0A4C1Y9P7_EUMVA|nr:hypothetical protein EVAR_89522_1 [Eumeta japonica]
MRSGAVRLCLVSVWWAAVGTSLPPPCPPRSSLYQRDGRDRYCIADTDDLCLRRAAVSGRRGRGCSGLRLHNSLEFFGFNKTEQGWERSTAESHTFVVPARSSYSLRYDIPHGYCEVKVKDYGLSVFSMACAFPTIAVPACAEGQHHDGAMCVNKASIG